MTKPNPAPWKQTFQLRDLPVALALLTRLPLPHFHFPTEANRPTARGAWAYPLVGVLLAVIAAAVGEALSRMGATAGLSAAFVLLALVMLSGAMHEDGLADCADGFWGGWTPDKRLKIMKDSVIGTYGVIALVLSLLLRWYLLVELITDDALLWALIIAAAGSRAAMVWVMDSLPVVRRDGLSGRTGRPSAWASGAAVLIAVVLTVLAPDVSAWRLVLLAFLAALVMRHLAKRKIGGQTGDVLGATQQVTEIALLIGCQMMAFGWQG
ncbi:adenosylcobinamide-GDP ribazoletransferase [Sulfitobacter sp. S0837]|uniref:adenosylcobinamide-GDP ribazoletransferase n=1 Tax=Sulfitobacter maritimus TaxID=2741719 RepID=UPI0015842EFD|nr:adenosylcobinamide-GDP ribazoletransferase [Sulfitobacter maritimus]NUH64787.1 adenosylcobinamide-GDP ribazoletransferase [Sulfitobacter maritimus]